MLKDNIEYIESLKRFGIKEGLNQIRKLCNLFGNPQDSFPSIHVAGTNGKGSTSTLIANVLEAAGYKVGLYTSPYLLNFNERIKVNSQEISDTDLDNLITNLKNKIESENLESTFFEFITAIAFQHFKNENVEIAVIETGLGGKLDATNIINSKLSLITNIGYDHVEILGKTKKEIAEKKSGIIKENQIFITSEEESNIRGIMQKFCKEKNTKFIYTYENIIAKNISQNLEYQTFETEGIFNKKIKTKLLGKHQLKNILSAITAVKNLEGFNISDEHIVTAINNTFVPGRLQIVSKKPLIIIDSAHNKEGIETLVDFIKTIDNKSTLLIGMAKDKDHKEILKIIAPLFKRVITTEGNFKPASADYIKGIVKNFNKNTTSIKSVSEALEEALLTSSKSDTILITGSIYMISEALKYIPTILSNASNTYKIATTPFYNERV